MTTTQLDDTAWDDASFVISSGYREDVLARLATSPATPTQLAVETEIALPHVSRALRELREQSLVELLVTEERRKGRIYGLTDRGAEISVLIDEMEIGIDD